MYASHIMLPNLGECLGFHMQTSDDWFAIDDAENSTANS